MRASTATFDDGDDVVYVLTPSYTPGSTMVILDLANGPLALGLYRLTVYGGSGAALHDLAGLLLDGDNNGVAGGDYVRTFTVNYQPGDYDRNGLVEEADFLFWRSHFGDTSGIGLQADGNGNGVVDAADYSFWRDSLEGLLMGAGSGGGVGYEGAGAASSGVLVAAPESGATTEQPEALQSAALTVVVDSAAAESSVNLTGSLPVEPQVVPAASSIDTTAVSEDQVYVAGPAPTTTVPTGLTPQRELSREFGRFAAGFGADQSAGRDTALASFTHAQKAAQRQPLLLGLARQNSLLEEILPEKLHSSHFGVDDLLEDLTGPRFGMDDEHTAVRAHDEALCAVLETLCHPGFDE